MSDNKDRTEQTGDGARVRTLRVFGWVDWHPDAPGLGRQARFIVAARSMAAAGRLVGKTPRQMFNICETGNRQELAIALECPGVVYWRGVNEHGEHPWRAVPE